MDGERRKLTRLPADETDGCGSRYLHPHGYVICRRKRTWSERGGPRGASSNIPPMVWWEVYEHVSQTASSRFRPWVHKKHSAASAATLRDARHWCDENPRDGWSARTAAHDTVIT
jgi:hypothetical protein